MALVIAFLITIILLGTGMGFFSVKYCIAKGENISRRIKENSQFLTTSIDLARSAQVSFKTQVQEWKNILLRGSNAEAFARHLEGFNKQIELTLHDLSALETLFKTSQTDTALITRSMADQQKLAAQYREALKSFNPARPETSALVDNLVKGIDRPVSDAIDALVAQAQKLGADVTQAEEAAFHQSTKWLLRLFIAGCTVGIVIGGVFAFLLSASILRQLKALAKTLKETSLQVASAAGQVASASHSLAEGASEQAASLEETSSSLEEMSSMTKNNAANANKVKDLGSQARRAGDAAMSEMQTMSAAMNDIKASSDGIAKIIKTIDEIAFQTNILALNAAVEAARAGEAGAGFAVVADEVRSLSQRCADAAKETATKIEDSVQKSVNGVQISSRVAISLAEIVGKARQVDALAGEVAAASAEQRQGIEQVNTAVSQMDQVTQSNAANAEESASAAAELNAQAENLKQAVHDLLTMVDGGKGASTSAQPATLAAQITKPHHGQPASGPHRRPAKPSHAGSQPDATLAMPSAVKDRGAIPMAEDFKNF